MLVGYQSEQTWHPRSKEYLRIFLEWWEQADHPQGLTDILEPLSKVLPSCQEVTALQGDFPGS